ncbi:PREDICTED: methyltransferase-like protein 6 [Priapulus caudatus]|uniref:tRNA N(3)-methylcytidine methyltransferase n=1 Tax=Priapulus caudatus TaxID=37621 RepID=A0ABM1DYZ2_PRICU|nr:PREDICTED: methyltransferase-like protein 6 [Priapulus caudatus]
MEMPLDTSFPSINEGGSELTRKLTHSEEAKLLKDTNLVSAFTQRKLEEDAKKNWDLFYKRNGTNFFKDRHWITKEFKELIGHDSGSTPGSRQILEVGCGVGNLLFPLLQDMGSNSNCFIYACDFSPRAVKFVRENALYSENNCHVFQCDLTVDNLCDIIIPSSLDFVTMVFVLSAINPEKMLKALRNVFLVLKPGGCVLFRDYGLYDYAQLRFKPGHKLSENFYVRQDGTRAYYFSLETITELFIMAGYETLQNAYVQKETVNKQMELCVPRIFVQSKFVKPCLS